MLSGGRHNSHYNTPCQVTMPYLFLSSKSLFLNSERLSSPSQLSKCAELVCHLLEASSPLVGNFVIGKGFI